MKKRVVRMLSILLLPQVLLLGAFFLPERYGRTYLAALKDKAAALDGAASPKIVLIGGSGAAFGTDSSLLEEQFPGYAAVNFGLYAGLGTTVMLELALPSLHRGDIVVFSPEMSEQTLSDRFGAESMWQAAEGDMALTGRLDASRLGELAAAFPRYAAGKARLFLEGTVPEGEGIYARASFTERGDIAPGLRPLNRMPGGWDKNTPLYFDPDLIDEKFIERVNAFTDACAQMGVGVYFRFCPMNLSALAAGEEERIGEFTCRLREKLHCGIIGTAERALMAEEWFFDTNFHLNDAGAVMNTILLAEDLKKAMGDDAPVTIPLPEMPASVPAGNLEGDDSDGDLFLYVSVPGGLSVSGLTEEGREREKLTVPASHDGMSVLAFDREVFRGNGRLRELTLQGNIRTVPDRAFEGCTALEAVILLQEDPGMCTVGEGLVTGTRANVYVPAGSYGDYCTNYFWSRYASRLLPTETPAASSAPAETPPPAQAPEKHSAVRIRYEGCGGTLRTGGGDSLTREITYAHLRENTLPGTMWFEREGYVLTGWNTEADGSGMQVGLGSRIDPARADTLYARWLPESSDGDFVWETDGRYAAVTGYLGEGEVCVLPQTHEGLPVRTVREGAFRGKRLSLLVLSPSLRTVEDGAFEGCALEEIILYDSLEAISDACFSSCTLPRVLRVNAATAPVYSGSYFDTFQDKYDHLLAVKDQRKLVLSSGSSGRYGYDSTLFLKAFPDHVPVNMGVYAFTNALPQLEIILPLTGEGDILLYAPEFDAVAEQFCTSDRLDTGFWAMMESCYDTAAALDMRRFSGVFDSLGEYLAARRRMPARDYTVSPARYDDDGNAYAFATYNVYGDFILPRPTGETDGRLRHNIADYTVKSFPPETVQSLNRALSPFSERGVRVFFTYTPRNIDSLTEESTPEAREALDGWLRERLEVPVISSPEDYLLPGRWFYLIDSHTGTEGARIRTERVIRDLEEALKDDGKQTTERSNGP